MAKRRVALAVALAAGGCAGADDSLRRVVLTRPDMEKYEASALLPVDDATRARLGFDEAYWTVSDEAAAHKALLLVAMKRDAGGAEAWSLEVPNPPPIKLSSKTEDAEALFRANDRVWIVGSMFGSKKNKVLEAKRHFVAVFDEATGALVADPAGPTLHRRINDWLRADGPALIERRAEGEGRLIADSIAAIAQAKPADRIDVAAEDRAINVEGAVGFPGGRILLGLRFPVTAEGNPILVLVGRDDPDAHAFFVLGTGTPQCPRGIRDLALGPDGAVYALTGSIDSDPAESAILAGYGGIETAKNALVRFAIPETPGAATPAVSRVPVEAVRAFPYFDSLEGVAFRPDGSPIFVEDSKEGVVVWMRR